MIRILKEGKKVNVSASVKSMGLGLDLASDPKNPKYVELTADFFGSGRYGVLRKEFLDEDGLPVDGIANQMKADLQKATAEIEDVIHKFWKKYC